DAEAHGRPVDRRDHGLLHVEDSQGHGAAAVAMLLGATIRFARCRPSRGWGPAGRGATIRFARCRPSRGWGPAGRGATIRFARCRPSRGWGPAGRGATIVERRSAGTEVGAGAERAAGPGHDDRAHAIVGVGALPRLAELADRRRGDGVE